MQNNNLKSIIISLFLIVSLYFTYIHFLYTPSNFKYFSLIDDAITLIETNSYYHVCLETDVCAKYYDQIFESGSTRFRPVYWMINNQLYELFGDNPIYHHSFRIYIVGLMGVLLLAVILYSLGISVPIIVLGVAMFFTNYSFTENIIRLGTNEPFQILFLALTSIFYLFLTRLDKSSKHLRYLLLSLTFISLLISLLIKETSVAIVGAILVHYFFVLKNYRLRIHYFAFIVPLSLLFLGMLVSKGMGSNEIARFPDYGTNYSLEIKTILINSKYVMISILNSTSPFIKISILLASIMYVSKKAKIYLINKDFIYWCLFAFCFALILFPWKYVLERYQLMSIFGISIVTSYVFDRFVKYCIQTFNQNKLTKFLTSAVLFIIVSNIFAVNLSFNLAKSINYSKWFAVFTTFENDQVEAIERYSDQTLLINGTDSLDNLEIIAAIPIMIESRINKKVKYDTLSDKIYNDSYIFSRSSFVPFDPVLQDIESNNRVLESNTYYVDQIDVLEFRNRFRMKPIQTLLAPPLNKNGYDYNWNITLQNNDK